MRRVNLITVCSEHPNTSTAQGYISWRAEPHDTTSCRTISTWTWCSDLMELMWMDFSLYLCHLTCISLIPLFFHLSVYLSPISISVCVCVCTCVCEWSADWRQSVSLGPLHLLCWCSQPTHLSRPLGKRKRGKEGGKRDGTPASEHPPPQLFSFTNTFGLCFCHVECLISLRTWVSIPMIRLWCSGFLIHKD